MKISVAEKIKELFVAFKEARGDREYREAIKAEILAYLDGYCDGVLQGEGTTTPIAGKE